MVDLTKLSAKDIKRFWSKVNRSSSGSCWTWNGSHKKSGYARFWFQNHVVAAHRVAYFIWYGDLDQHLEVDHTCRNVDCINPFHLEAVCPDLNRQRRIEHHRKAV